MRDRPELTVLDAIVLLEISPEQAHDGPNLLDALAGFVDRFRVARDLVAADFLERLLKSLATMRVSCLETALRPLKRNTSPSS
jgi:hypothetical protein